MLAIFWCPESGAVVSLAKPFGRRLPNLPLFYAVRNWQGRTAPPSL